MVPVAPASVSLFGAPLGVAPILNFNMNSAAGLSANPLTPSAAVPVSVPPSVPVSGSAGVAAAAPAPFADLLTEAVGSVEQLEKQAKVSIEGLISGKGVDVHEAMIAAQKAGMGFEMVLAVRNKALSAYQQVMGMQF